MFDEPLHVPDGTVARVDFLPPAPATAAPLKSRRGGQWKGCVVVALDFDVLPDDLREAFGMKGLLRDTRGERRNIYQAPNGGYHCTVAAVRMTTPRTVVRMAAEFNYVAS